MHLETTTAPGDGSTIGPVEAVAPAAPLGPARKLRRASVVMFVTGVLAGLALGIPAGSALSRVTASEGAAAASQGAAMPSPELARLIGESQTRLNEKQPERALAALLAAERLDPKNELIQNNLCVAYMDLGRPDAAIAACKTAILLNGDFQLARNNLAWVQSTRDKASHAAAPPSAP
jgi:tetratricopeptide (TPR) repeat protein